MSEIKPEKPARTIDSIGIARLIGANSRCFAMNKLRNDPKFPKPISGLGVAGNRYQWDLAAILHWKESYVRSENAHDQPPRIESSLAGLVIRLGWKRAGEAVACKGAI